MIVERVWAISDVHTDHKENIDWVCSLSNSKYQSDALVVAGDVSHYVCVLMYTLKMLKTKFKYVLFTPGNHDLWLNDDRGHAEKEGQKLKQTLDHHRRSGGGGSAGGEEDQARSRSTTEVPELDDKETFEELFPDSLNKLTYLLDACERHGVFVWPRTFEARAPPPCDAASDTAATPTGTPGAAPSSTLAHESGYDYGRPRRHEVRIVPLLSWHHPSFDTEPDLDPEAVKAQLHTAPPPLEKVVNDYRRCRWPRLQEGGRLDDIVAQNVSETQCEAVARRVDRVNDSRDWPLRAAVDAARTGVDADPSAHQQEGETRTGERTATTVISFSHFLPRVELIPEKRFLFYQHLARCSGSRYLRSRVEALHPNVHVFGHTHFGWDQELDGVRYVQASLSYPYERRMRFPSLEIGTLASEPLLLFDFSAATEADRLPVYHARWSGYYAQRPRTPHDSTLAQWVIDAYRTLDR